MKTKLEIIDETVSYYFTHDRSLGESPNGSGEMCKYNGDNNAKCAYSRCCTEDSVFDEGKGVRCQFVAKLLPEYEHISDENFWEDLQSLHDRSNNWHGKILTLRGINHVKDMKQKYSLN